MAGLSLGVLIIGTQGAFADRPPATDLPDNFVYLWTDTGGYSVVSAGAWIDVSTGGGGGVTSIDGGGGPLTGAVTFSEGTGIDLTQVGQDIEIAATPAATLDQEGSGSPVGTVTPTGVGYRYTDTNDGAVYLAVGLTDADWVALGGLTDGTVPGVVTDAGTAVLLGGAGTVGGQRVLKLQDVLAFSGTGNQLALRATGTDGEQFLDLQLGPAGEFTWTQDATGRSIFPGALEIKDTLAPDVTAAGLTVQKVAGENLVFGDPVYMKSDGKVWKADANTAGTFPAVGIAAATIAANATGTVLLHGSARNDAWAWTIGGLVYLSTSAGLTQTQPSATDDAIQILGIAHPNADTLYVNPQLTYITHT